MNTKSFRVRDHWRTLAVIIAVALLVSSATVLRGSAGLASNEQLSEDFKSAPSQPGSAATQPAVSELGSPLGEAELRDCPQATLGTDRDTLDMTGCWDLTLGYSEYGGFLISDSSGGPLMPWGGLTPPGVTYRVSFEPGVRSSLSSRGYKYNGSVTYARSPLGGLGQFVNAETFYDGRGVQVVQMRWEDRASRGRYYGLFSGAHKPYNRNWVVGGWVDVGNATCGDPGGSAYVGSFVMVKVSDRPCNEAPPPKSP